MSNRAVLTADENAYAHDDTDRKACSRKFVLGMM